MENYLLIGKITGVHGVRGVVKLWSYAESASLFDLEFPLFIKKKNSQQNRYVIEWAKPHKKGLLLALKGVNSREQAELLTGADVFIEKSRLPELEKDVYYWDDLIGLSVQTLEGEYLGRITSVMPTGSNDVYVIKDGKRETLIPAIASVVVEINLEERLMRVCLPEGL